MPLLQLSPGVPLSHIEVYLCFVQMIYEALAGSYWPAAATEAMILHQLATPGIPLPHESRPPEPGNIASMLRVRPLRLLVGCGRADLRVRDGRGGGGSCVLRLPCAS